MNNQGSTMIMSKELFNEGRSWESILL